MRGLFGWCVLVSVALAGCEGSLAVVDTRDAGEPPAFDGGVPEASVDAAVPDAEPPLPPGVAPDGLVPEAEPEAPSTMFALAPGEARIMRVEVGSSEHVGFHFFFSPSHADVVMHVDRYDGMGEAELGLTDGGRGVRFLAVFEPEGARTHWVRVEAGEDAVEGTLEVVHTPFSDGMRCLEDCDRLLQLPLPLDPRVDGYDFRSWTVMRYWFGRRDLLMMVRHAGRTMASLGYPPFVPGDFSQWDGETPGVDTGYLRHGSHQRGKDVDLPLYGADGRVVWRSYCEVVVVDGGRTCVPGTASGLDGIANAILYGAILDSDRVTMSFLDRELIPIVAAGAEAAAADGQVSAESLPRFTDGRRLQHWRNHDNHIHVRVSEESYESAGTLSLPWEFEAP